MARIYESGPDRLTKVYSDRIGFENELNIYSIMSGTGLVPELLMQETEKLTFRKVIGPTLSERIEEILGTEGSHFEELSKLSASISNWFVSFEQLFLEKTSSRLLNGDLNPRNLLFGDDICVGIDFEKATEGNMHRAAAQLLGMIRSMDMPDADKTILLNRIKSAICSSLCLDEQLVNSLTAEIVRLTQERRARMERIRLSSCGILAGGKATRMGGIDKSSLMLGKYSFMERLLHTADMFDRIMISSNNDKTYPYPSVRDIYRDIGPLGAIHSLLSACETESLMVIPCDTPLLKRGTVFNMYRQIKDADDALVLRCSGRTYPVIGIYKKRILPIVESAIQEGNYALKGLLDRLNVSYCDVDDEIQVMNVNSPEDLTVLIRAFDNE